MILRTITPGKQHRNCLLGNVYFISLYEKDLSKLQEKWVKHNNSSRAIHWWIEQYIDEFKNNTMTFYIRRKTNFCSGFWVAIFNQKIIDLGPRVQHFESWFLDSRFGPPTPPLGVRFPFKVLDYQFQFLVIIVVIMKLQ